MATIGFGVRLRGIHFEDWHLPFNLAAGITAGDVGKAVTLDATAANTVKLAGDGDAVLGRLEVVESRVQEGVLVGTVALKFAGVLPVKTGQVVAVGNTVVGAGAGEVKAAATADHAHNLVVEVLSGNRAVVIKP